MGSLHLHCGSNGEATLKGLALPRDPNVITAAMTATGSYWWFNADCMWETFKKIRDLLEPRARFRALLLLGMMLVMAALETTGVASIMPFVAVLANPDVVETNKYLSTAYHWLGFDRTQHFLFFLGLIVLVAIIASTAFKALTMWAMLRFSSTRSHALSRRLFEGYLHQPYAWFLRRHSGDLNKTMLSEVGIVIGGALVPAMQLVAQGIVTVFMITMLLVVDPLLALTVAVVLGGGYWLVFWASRRRLHQAGEARVRANRERFRLGSEAFAGIKDVKFLGLEDFFLQRFEKQSRLLAKHQVTSDTMAQLPQHALSAIGLIGIMLIVQYLLSQGSLDRALPLIALYALTGTRLLPAMQRVYQSFSKLRSTGPALANLHRDLREQPLIRRSPCTATPPGHTDMEPVHLTDRLELRDVRFCYPCATNPAVDRVSLIVPARASMGLVGQTGAGKTTLVDIILGLLNPDSGQLLVDGIPINGSNRRNWQRSVGYVPQQIFIADDTVAANIAFGIPPAKIDKAAVERAAQIANLHEFVTTELELGYHTVVGERGVRLSGGQRQRVGIARALYRNPVLLVMDEATSALDNITERAVMDAMANLAGQMTMILIAHRLTTVRHCDVIFLLEHGKVAASGSYDALMKSSLRFREMAQLGIEPRQKLKQV